MSAAGGHATPEEVARLVAGFRRRDLPAGDWTHRAHLHVGLATLAESGLEEGVRTLRAGIRAYNEATGKANTATSGYHETITLFFAWALLEHARAQGSAEDPFAAHAALEDSPLADKRCILEHWTREALASPAARLGWLAPDLRPLPPGVSERLATLAERTDRG